MSNIYVIQGGSGTAKSTIVCGFAKNDLVGVIDMDTKFKEVIPNFTKLTGVSPKLKIRLPQQDQNKNFIPTGSAARWLRFKAINKDFCEDPNVKYIAWDTCTELMNFCKDAIVAADPKPNQVGGRKIMSLSGWGPLEADFREEMMRVVASGKTLLLLVHDKLVEDEISGMKTIVPDMQAGLKNLLPKLASEWWHTETRVKHNQPTQYVVCCQPNRWGNWKSALGLPAEWTFSVEALEKKIQEKDGSKGFENVDLG